MKTERTLVLHIGMLWRGDNNDIYNTIAAAAGHYFAKFGKHPEYCHVHPEAFGTTWPTDINNINMKIRPDSSIQPKHVWVGVIQ